MPIPAGGSATPTVPWAPSLVKVADRLPGRTLVKVFDGSNNEVMTFDSTTRPTGASVLRLIDDSVEWVKLATGTTVDLSLYGAAMACAEIYTAASIERGYPERESQNEKDAQATAAALFAQAADIRKDLAARNDILIGENPEVFEIAPPWSFPPGVPDDYGFVPTIF
jgi:hypothetical protein